MTKFTYAHGGDVLQRLEHRITRIPESGCWFWMGALSRGYGRANVNGRFYLLHRLMWEAHNGPIPAGMCVLHRCDIKCCINPNHLFLGTQTDNMADKVEKGRHTKGRTHGMSKLTEALVAEIRASPESGRAIAKRLGVDPSTIYFARRGVTWRHVHD